MIKALVVFLFLGLNTYTYYFMAQDAVIPERATFQHFPMRIADWSCDGNVPLAEDVLRNLGATDTLVCDYQRASGEVVGFYVGYHATQVREEGGGAGENAIHPPAHCLPGSGWDIIDASTVPVDVSGLSEPGAGVKRLIIAKGPYRQLVYYWYQSRGRVIAEDWQKVLFVGLDRATQGRTDGALVRFTVPVERDDIESADALFRDFASRVVPELPPFVPN
ncbi:MAG: exosortase C-terminal domain/associated protein EpsI [Myxococcota bacterium]